MGLKHKKSMMKTVGRRANFRRGHQTVFILSLETIKLIALSHLLTFLSSVPQYAPCAHFASRFSPNSEIFLPAQFNRNKRSARRATTQQTTKKRKPLQKVPENKINETTTAATITKTYAR